MSVRFRHFLGLTRLLAQCPELFSLLPSLPLVYPLLVRGISTSRWSPPTRRRVPQSSIAPTRPSDASTWSTGQILTFPTVSTAVRLLRRSTTTHSAQASHSAFTTSPAQPPATVEAFASSALRQRIHSLTKSGRLPPSSHPETQIAQAHRTSTRPMPMGAAICP